MVIKRRRGYVIGLLKNKYDCYIIICSGFKSNKDNNIIKTFKKLSNKFTLIHAHGNNFGLILNNIPDIIELTYINKSYIKTFKLNNEILPIKDLDFPNSRRYHDINLGFYPFTNNLYIHSPKTMLWYFLNFRKYIQSFIFISVIIIINYNPYISIGLLEHGLFGH